MELQAKISASEFDENYEMALVYCFDNAKDYCFSLVRLPDSDEIEVMVLDQVNHRVNDLLLTLNPSSIEVSLSDEASRKLDGHISYSIKFNSLETDINGLSKALQKYLKGKRVLLTSLLFNKCW